MNQHELEDHLAGRAEEEAQTPAEDPVETPVAEETETVQEQEPVEDDPVQQYLAKYGGDTDKALRAAVEAQSLIGRQGGELGEIRKQLQDLQSSLNPQQPEQQYEPVTDENIAWADQMAYDDNWQQAAMWALENQPLLYERIINTRGEMDPINVNRFETSLALRAQQQQFQQQMNPIVQPVIQQQLQDQFTHAWTQVKRENPDLDDYTPQLLKVAEDRPHLLSVLQQGTSEAKQQVIRDLYLLAKGSAAAPLAVAAQQASQEAVDGAAALRQQAAVATMTGSAPVQPARSDAHLDEWRAAFREEAGLSPLE